MNIQTLMTIYISTCLCVLVFSICYIQADKRQKGTLKKRSKAMEQRIERQIDLLTSGQEIGEAHKKYIRHYLKRMRKLEAFDTSIKELGARNQAGTHLYLKALRGEFVYLSEIYLKRDDLEKAYFAYLIGQYRLGEKDAYDNLLSQMVGLTTSRSVYCRENALKAIYASGNVEAVEIAIEQMSRLNILHNSKLLVDGLLSFQGNQEELADRLWSHEQEFPVSMKLTIMQFIRRTSPRYCEVFLPFLTDESMDRELRFEAIRYFRKNVYEPAGKILVNFLHFEAMIDWEYAAIAASALGSYPGPETVSALKTVLASHNWYVRFNAAETLVHTLRVPYLELMDIYNSNDRYAREILEYMIERDKWKNKQGGGNFRI